MVAPIQSDPVGRPLADAPSPATGGDLHAYLAELLADQQKLQTPVTRAATAHALQPSAWRAEKFRELVPLTAPAPGQQYAFEVDLDSCSGCKACVSGCHSLNGLDDEETWRDVGVVYGLSALAASAPSSISHHTSSFQQTVTTACHHCADPACLNGCPVLAYEKDPVTGIVRHLDDQCIGCSYCILKCPYDVPKYNERLGIVRKCDLCQGRLAVGEAPACAQACPTQAIKIVLVSVPGNAEPPSFAQGSGGRGQLGSDSDSASGSKLPAPRSPLQTLAAISGTDSAYTRPTTRYVSKKPLPAALRAADADSPRPQHAHLALVALLVGTQLSLGLLVASFLTGSAGFQPASEPRPSLALAAAALFAAALAASVFHLGQPLRAWRVFLNLRRSWLSREAVVLGAAFPLVATTAILPHLASLPLPTALAEFIGHWSLDIGHFAPLVSIATIALTAAGVFCSAMIYIDTRRRFWRPANTFVRMAGTVLIAALVFIAPPFAALALLLKLGAEIALLLASPLSARLHAGPLRGLFRLRLGLAAAAALPLALQQPWFGFILFALGEAIERALYFRAVDAPKMPGQPGPSLALAPARSALTDTA
ncbi:MAG: dimethyl sulfoxide reductase anchor subunit [Burkholderiales bacterium]|nr:dimethyl sulfoxide reductase anchor subunit [Opitutaceae bacterium]